MKDFERTAARPTRRAAACARALALCWLLSPGLPTLAQPPDEPVEDTPSGDFFEVVSVEIANIDVWVTDKGGNPVAGLEKNDFVVTRDGKSVEIANFYAVSGGRSAATTAPERASAESNTRDRSRALERGAIDQRANLPAEHQLWLVVYIDNYNIDPNERNRIFPALRAFLSESLRSGGQTMIVTYDRALEVAQPFTRQFSLLEAALEKIKTQSGLAVVRERSQISTLQRIDRSRDTQQAMLYARQHAEEVMNEVQYTADSLDRFIESLAGLPGRKALIHVSSGVPMTAGEEMFHAVAEKFHTTLPYSQIPRHDTTRRFERVNRNANQNRVVFYTVDAGGLRGMRWGNAEYAGFVDMDLRSTLDSIVPENLQAPLRMMARETGGQAILNQNEILPALRRAGRDFRSFYSLGLASGDAVEDAYHEIKVKLLERRKGLLVRHRMGYRSKSQDTRARESLNAALLYSHADNPGEVDLAWGPTEPSERGNHLLPILLRIPIENIVLLPTTPESHEARLRLFVGAVGAESNLSEIDVVPFGVRLKNEHVEAAKGESLLHTHRLLLGPGRKKIGVAILDLFGNELSVVTRFVEIAPP